ncbi:hypothetical protein EA795_19210 [Stutzerimonas nitrititolerans]|uniref:Uncharacterized protein n=2 Tax=Stutzerimonas nitrititolerans TaxID=2482751 RepID=A0ABX9UVB2_9GAMM|nr:hypothetical protein EA795_19210 [Stutzerimonas nitrititolerans]
MEENARLREVLRCIADLPMDRCSTENDYRLSAAKAIALGALSQQAEPLYVTHRPLIRNAINLLGMRRPVAPDVQRVIDDLEAMLCGQSTPAGAPSEEWLQVATLAEPAPAQDEREAFEAHMRLGGYSNPEKHHDGSYVSSAMELWWQGWKARATRPAQTEQQPSTTQQVLDLILEECRYWQGRDEARRGGFACLYAKAKEIADNAAPIAQTAPQPEQSGLVEALEEIAAGEKTVWRDDHFEVENDMAIDYPGIAKAALDAYRATLSAQGASK